MSSEVKGKKKTVKKARGKNLTENEKRFIELYITNWNATQSYMEAYGTEDANAAGVQGWRLLRKSKIVKIISQFQEQRREQAKRDHLDVLADIRQIKERCMGGQKYRPKEALKALELEGKHYGMYEDNLNVKGKLSIADLLDDE